MAEGPWRRGSDDGRSKHGTDLVINLRGQRRVLALPDALAALDIAGATLADGHLTVRFA